MARRCALTGKQVQFGHNVSHSNRKTNRRFEPNIQLVSLASDALRESVSLRVSTRALRTVVKKGGLDAYLLDAKDDVLMPEARKLKRRIRRALGTRAAS